MQTCGTYGKLSNPDHVPPGVNNFRRHFLLQAWDWKGLDGEGGLDAVGLGLDHSQPFWGTNNVPRT